MKVTAEKEHKMLNTVKKYINKSSILETDEHIKLIDISGEWSGKVYTYFSGVNNVFFRVLDYNSTNNYEPEITVYSIEYSTIR